MSYDEEVELYTSPEQIKSFALLEKLSGSMTHLVDLERTKALTFILDTTKSSTAKLYTLSNYFDFRMFPQNCIVNVDNNNYSILDLEKLASSIYEDSSFLGSDSELVLKNRVFFYESIIIDDIVLARHFYRLSNQSEQSLSYLVRMIVNFTSASLSEDKNNFNRLEENPSFDIALEQMKKLLRFVENYLKKNRTYLEKYKSTFGYSQAHKQDFFSRFELNATQQLSQINPADIRIDELYSLFQTQEGYQDCFDFHIKWLLDELYASRSTNKDIDNLQNTSPTFNDFLLLVDKRCQSAPREESTREDPLLFINDFLHQLKKSDFQNAFNNLALITNDDVEKAQQKNEEVDIWRAFENIKNFLPSCFIILNSAQEIPELDNTINYIEIISICRDLCTIYQEAYAAATIEFDPKSNPGRVIQSELEVNRKIVEEKNALFKSFLDIAVSSSVEELLNYRIKLLDEAKAIDPFDTFIEECSIRILNLLKGKVNSKDLSSFKTEVESALHRNTKRVIGEKIINTLATAEYLFSTYVNEKYAEENFDFSCISALYYQAFENAYNDLIWSKYSNYLNNQLLIEDKPYCDTLKRRLKNNRDLDPTDPCFGYLPKKMNNLRYYFNTKTYAVNDTCMYASFSILLDNTKHPEPELSHFYDWLASEFHFTNFESMKHNSSFMVMFDLFKSKMKAAVDWRNNASHGGSTINKCQCINDKNTILTNLEEIREMNLGLIQLLINIYCFNC